MMKDTLFYARVEGDVVAEVLSVDADGPSVGELFHPAIAAALLPAHPAVRPGWRWDGREFRAAPDDAGSADGPETAAAMARVRRASLLAASDWTQLADAPLSERAQAAWRAYRQQLRDVPQQPGFPTKVDWPEPPRA